MEKTPSAQIGLSPSESTVPEHSVVIAPARGWASLQVRAIWEYRELLYFLVWRDLKVRYKQTVLGVVWILLQPVLPLRAVLLVLPLMTS